LSDFTTRGLKTEANQSWKGLLQSYDPHFLDFFTMGGKTEANQSREGLLQSYNNGESQPLQNSQDGYSSSTDDDLDATEYLRQSSPHAPTNSASPRSFVGLRKSIRRRSKCLIILITVLVVFWSVLVGGGYWIYKKKPVNGQSPPWYPTPPGGTVSQWDESYKKAEALVKKMTLLEKVNITTGTGWQMGLAVGNSAPAIHVGFPGLAYQDGPLGLRFADNATAFPAGVTVGATWSKELMYRRGKAHGNEARLKGINVLLGPCVGPIGKLPAGGRNWEVSFAQLSAICPIQN
jgi:hypothetical protein